ncbi:MAG: dephospho-CoA kinase [candidate division KSB1 bacterium]|nr:dephospho-CoA kinase [candidate division KSB1 bacterium]
MKKPVVGLTGTLGSGKSLAAQMMRDRGACIVDMDQVGKWVVDHDPAVRKELQRVFGSGIFDSEGRLRRSELAQIVFNDKEALARLNAAVHPAMVNRAVQEVEKAKRLDCRCVVVDAALLFELGFERYCDLTVFVDAPLQVCLERAVRFKGFSREQALARIAAQWPAERKRAMADRVLDNSGSSADLERQVDELMDFISKNY